MTHIIAITLKRFRQWPLLYYWLPLLGWMGIIFWLSAQPEPFDLPESWQDKLVGMAGHAIGYAGLALLWWRALNAQRFVSPSRVLASAFFLTMLYAILDELHQAFVPGRSCDAMDLLIDAAGAAPALWLAHLWKTRQISKRA